MLRNGLEPWHLLIVAIVIIVLFGSKRLPDAARAVGKSMRILKSETKAMKEEGEGAAHPAPSAQASSTQASSAQASPAQASPARASSVEAPVAAARPAAAEGADAAR
ncbi:Sec-independent protein translocase subunit TatA [Streptomyces scopuliridis]|uniref:Sec-independent protein translocase subunit TatA n=1 Tax=Streptomyces scopuliridis TaxID=452529 RepID=A0ACD4ZYV0_9ACTN|nr:Sec-independent protein translocase subunit TatA [Streptomyces scopuliridis]WSC03099.1 Sec-independent protein translocase subunit TatA [Streptomyces scopuliridis]WSC11025.1 Sec-independent protein translocase subunit TatA [Streptomyces scopuliridis]